MSKPGTIFTLNPNPILFPSRRQRNVGVHGWKGNCEKLHDLVDIADCTDAVDGNREECAFLDSEPDTPTPRTDATACNWLPVHLRPPNPPPSPPAIVERSLSPPQDAPPQVPHVVHRTKPNAFGLYREYTYQPQHDPEDDKTFRDLVDSVAFPLVAPRTTNKAPSAFRQLNNNSATTLSGSESQSSSTGPSRSNTPLPDSTYAPLRNASEYHLLRWQSSTSSATSNQAVNSLVRDVIHAPGFSPSHFPPNFTIQGARTRLEKGQVGDSEGSPLRREDGWIKTRVKIHVPKEGRKFKSEEDAPVYEVEGVYIHDFMAVLECMYGGPAAADYHWVPHKLFWQPRIEARMRDPSTDKRASTEAAPSRRTVYHTVMDVGQTPLFAAHSPPLDAHLPFSDHFLS
ncbi:hypothetical protein DICSQDRAFT_175537 [Dichomitus squalens LYAD-421 SS1]|uniref:Uncharacterized protein n=1 Tax=Dichomitus squalens (strain LYAD-421) TaxID=732165 RepID=R7SI18_DICSQ|nr:uncharacterized protein DICSQDRAFT_175537 [Dichomitus squalens LYAD-421 SS1]EJF55784.1 hypothetical protein DICSQDRAFT_175537 [Dichomitus squalens LYAD-421 SS1]